MKSLVFSLFYLHCVEGIRSSSVKNLIQVLFGFCNMYLYIIVILLYILCIYTKHETK